MKQTDGIEGPVEKGGTCQDGEGHGAQGQSPEVIRESFQAIR